MADKPNQQQHIVCYICSKFQCQQRNKPKNCYHNRRLRSDKIIKSDKCGKCENSIYYADYSGEFQNVKCTAANGTIYFFKHKCTVRTKFSLTVGTYKFSLRYHSSHLINDEREINMAEEKTCFFSGHRRIPKNQIEHIKQKVRAYICELANTGVTHFIAGGALGFDTLCADMIIELQESSIEFAQKVRLSLYLPCYDQTRNWSAEDKYHFNMIKFKASDCKYITNDTYTADCMRKRNYAMVDSSDMGIVYLTRYKSGTSQTVAYAEKKGHKIINVAAI